MNRIADTLLFEETQLRRRVLYFVLFLFSMGLYAGALSHDYNMDDSLVTKGHQLTSKGFAGIAEILSSPYYEDKMGYSYEYRPITHISFAIEHGLFGESSWCSHLVNMLLHSITVVLVFVVASILSTQTSLLFPVLAASLFAVHPIHTEVVANIKNRDELLALLFVLLAVLFVFKALKTNRWPYWLSIPVFLTLSLLSKASGAAFLFLIPLYGLLRKETSSQQLLGLLTAALIPLTIYGHLKQMPWFWLSDFVFAIAALPLLIVFWRLLRKIDLSKLLQHLRPLGWPANEYQSLSRIFAFRWFDYIILALVLIVGYGGFLLKNPIPIALIICILSVSPLWTKNQRGPLLLLLILATSLLSFLNAYSGMGYILLFYSITVYASLWSGRNVLVNVFLILLASIPYIISEVRVIPSWHISTYFQTAIELLLPIIPFILTIIIKDSFPRFRKFFWTWTFSIGLLDFINPLGVNEFFIACGSGFGLLYFGLKPRKWPLSPQALVTTLLVVCVIATGTKPIYDAHNQKPIAIDQADQVEHEPSAESRPAKVIFSMEDRPLAFAEYPLDSAAAMGDRLGTAFNILGHYITMMFMPYPQAFYYGYNEVPLGNIFEPKAIGFALLHLLLFIAAIYFWRHHAVFSFGLGAYLFSIALFSNLISPVAGMMADRLAYVASFGFCIALGYAISCIYQRMHSTRSRRAVLAFMTVLLVSYSGMTIARNAKWKDALTLMRNDITHVPNSAQAHNLLASYLMRNSYLPEYAMQAVSMQYEATGHLKQAIRIWPEFFNAWYDLGRIYQTLGETDNAIACYKEVHRQDSTYFDATMNVAFLSEKKGDNATAITYYERCIRFNPDMLPAYSNLSFLYFKARMFSASLEVNERAIVSNPKWVEPYQHIAQTYDEMGEPDKAAAYRAKAANL